MNSVVDKGVAPDKPAPRERSALEHYLDPLTPWLSDPDITDLAINRPNEVWTESRSKGWACHHAPFVSTQWCMHFAALVANYTGQKINQSNPILSGTLPGGERIQIVTPPAVLPNEVSLSIRCPADEIWTLDELDERGVFDNVRVLPHQPAVAAVSDFTDVELELMELLRSNRIRDFLRRGVQTKQNYLASGATGSGKTTVSKALLLEVPRDERCLSFEDAAEIEFRNQPNHVRLFYSQGGQGMADITLEDLLTSSKRMYPSRVFVSEIRTGDDVYYYLTSVASGHPGSITSAHSGSAENAFWTLAQLMQNSGPGATMSLETGVRLAQSNIDIVLQCRAVDRKRFISEIWYDPSTKRRNVA